jgi:hypothetical protein
MSKGVLLTLQLILGNRLSLGRWASNPCPNFDFSWDLSIITKYARKVKDDDKHVKGTFLLFCTSELLPKYV